MYFSTRSVVETGHSNILDQVKVFFHSSQGLTETQSQVDGLVGGFVQQAADWRSLAAMMAGGVTYRLGRMGAMATGTGRLASLGIGLGAEVTAFEMANRSLSSLIGETHSNPNLWRWGGQGGIRQGLLSSLVTFGTLKGAGRLAQGENVVVQHLLQDTGMVLGHQVSASFGITDRPQGTLAEQFLHAEVTNLQLSAGMALAHSFAPGIQGVERGLDLSLRSTEIPPTPLLQRGARGDFVQPALAVAEGPSELPPWFAMSGPKDGDSRGGSSEAALPVDLPKAAVELGGQLIAEYPQAGPEQQRKIDIQVDAMIRSPEKAQFRMGLALLSHLLPHRSDSKRLLVTASTLIRKADYYREGPVALELMRGIVRKLEERERSMFLLRLVGNFPADAVSILKVLEGVFPVLSEVEQTTTLESLFDRSGPNHSYQHLGPFLQRISSHLGDSTRLTLAARFLSRLSLFREYRSQLLDPVIGVWKELVSEMEVESLLSLGAPLIKELPAMIPELQGSIAGVFVREGFREFSSEQRKRFLEEMFNAAQGSEKVPLRFTETVLREASREELLSLVEKGGVARERLKSFVLPPPEAYTFILPWQESIKESWSLVPVGFIRKNHVPLSKIVPVHSLKQTEKGEYFLETLQRRRLVFLAHLLMGGFRPGELPSQKILEEALTSGDDRFEHLPVITLPSETGKVLLLNGHHRIGVLISLVGAGILPPEILNRIPVHQIRTISPYHMLYLALEGDETRPLSSFSWRDVMAFDPLSLAVLEKIKPADLQVFSGPQKRKKKSS